MKNDVSIGGYDRVEVQIFRTGLIIGRFFLQKKRTRFKLLVVKLYVKMVRYRCGQEWKTQRANRLPEADSAQGFVAPYGSKFEFVKEEDDRRDAYSEARLLDPFDVP